MAAIKIPSSFQLMGKTYTVQVVPRDEWADAQVWGDFNPATNEIRVVKLGAEATEQTFYHELMHAILTAMNHKLNTNEPFIDMFSGLLHQALKTAK